MQPGFKIGDKAVYPAHGVGEVLGIERREILGTKQDVYVLKILDNGMKIMIPTNNVRQVGLREVISKSKVDKVFRILREKDLSVDTTTWNRRYREYMEKIKTGSVFEVAEVLRDLYLLKSDKDLKNVPVVIMSRLNRKTFCHYQRCQGVKEIMEPAAFLGRPPEVEELLGVIQQFL